MSNQPLSIERYTMLMCISICLSLCGQGIGLLLGAIFDTQVAVFLSTIGCIPFVLFAGFLFNLNSIPSYIFEDDVLEFYALRIRRVDVVHLRLRPTAFHLFEKLLSRSLSIQVFGTIQHGRELLLLVTA